MKKTIVCIIVLTMVFMVGGFAQAEVSRDGLIAEYLFNGNADDTSGNENHGTLYGPTLTEDRFGNSSSAYSFDGVDDYIEVSDSDSLDVTTGITIEAWVNIVEDKPGGLHYVVESRPQCNTSLGGYVLNVDIHSIQFGVFLGAYISNAPSIIQIGQWHHVVGTYDGSELIVYVDAKVMKRSLGVSDFGPSGTLYIGQYCGFSEYFHGTMDEVAIWNRALTSEEVLERYKAVPVDIKPGIYPNTFNCNKEKEVIDVAILTTEVFDATTVDHTTVTFEGASETHTSKGGDVPKRHEKDVDGDGDIDLLFHFRIGDTDLTCASSVGTLTGETYGGMPVEGMDSITSEGPYACYEGVPKTGQTILYATGDDGDLEKGVAWSVPRFTKNGNGTVTDNLTNLVWSEDAYIGGRKTWADAIAFCNNLASGSYGLTDGSNSGDWRLPNINELVSLIHWGVYNPAIPNTMGTGQLTDGNPFINVELAGGSPHYWSGTTYIYPSPDEAFCVPFTSGGIDEYPKAQELTVWCVRDGN